MKQIVAIVMLISGLIITGTARAQDERPVTQQYRLVEGIVQISEPGEESVLINLWGDVNAPGRFRISTGTTLIELISFARGPVSFRTGETTLDWSKLRVEVNVSRRNKELNIDEVVNFRFRYTQQLPHGMRDFVLQENDFITIEVKRRPAFVDYMRIVGPISTVVAAMVLLVDKL
jgi:protein involved in polysaccharide export with SLBB domain